MPNCFRLTKKGQAEPASLVAVDEELCAVVGMPVDPIKYCCGWFDVIGFMIALGKPLGSPELREAVKDWGSDRLMQMLDFLETHYTSDAWVEVGRR